MRVPKAYATMSGDPRLGGDNSPDSWHDLAAFVREARDKLMPQWRYQVDASASFDHELTKWLNFERFERAKVDALAAQWIDGKPVNVSSPEVSFLFCVRLNALAEILDFASYQKDGVVVSPFPFPVLPREDILRQLLIGWWAGKGVFLAFERMYMSA